MRVYETSDIRNVALVGHGNSGKTSLVAGFLFASGATSRLTRTDDGTTITDFDEEEIARKITISTAVAAAEWGRKKINLIDTPGFNMFINDTKASMVAADAALVVVDGVAGVEVQTEKVWSFTDEFKLPRAVVINKLDRERSSFERALESVQSVFGRTAVPIQLPLGAEREFNGVIDLVRMKSYTYTLDGDGKGKEGAIPDSSGRTPRRARMKRWSRWWPRATTRCSKSTSTRARCRWSELSKGCATRFAQMRIFPVLCASGLHNVASDLILNFIDREFPQSGRARPLERHPQRHRSRARGEGFGAGFGIRVQNRRRSFCRAGLVFQSDLRRGARTTPIW